LVAFALALVLPRPDPAQAADIREQTVFIPSHSGLLAARLEVQVYAPNAEGRFPLVVINHGKAPGNPSFQRSGQFYAQALRFVERGYVVIAPNRQGFSRSGGRFIEAGCQIESVGDLGADDVEAAIAYARTLANVDASQIVVIGQSVGGLVTVALGARNPAGVVGIVNFAGGIREDQCDVWAQNVARAFASFGRTSRMPALFIYGDNDSYFPQPLPQQFFDAYQAAGGHATMIDFGAFERDSHTLFHRESGEPIWMPAVAHFFASLGLSFDVKYDLYRRGSPGGDVEDLTRLNAVTHDSASIEAGYRRFLREGSPRAFAFSADGHWGIGRGDDSQNDAVLACRQHTQLDCRIYATDQRLAQ
jgi:dienelactone hydrolase